MSLHTRRSGRNGGVALSLIAFAAVVFGLTVVKISNTGPVEGFDHVVRPEMVEESAMSAPAPHMARQLTVRLVGVVLTYGRVSPGPRCPFTTGSAASQVSAG